MYQYFERRALGRIDHPSHLFLHRMIRKLMRVRGNVDTNLRTALKALARFGAPPEDYWPYECDNLDAEPDPFLYAFSSDCRAMVYLRLDRPGRKGAAVLGRVKAFLQAGFPVAFGFAVPSSLTAEGEIPYRPRYDAVQGGQAVVAVGYDDDPRGSQAAHCWCAALGASSGAKQATVGCLTLTSKSEWPWTSGSCCDPTGSSRVNSSDQRTWDRRPACQARQGVGSLFRGTRDRALSRWKRKRLPTPSASPAHSSHRAHSSAPRADRSPPALPQPSRSDRRNLGHTEARCRLPQSRGFDRQTSPGGHKHA